MINSIKEFWMDYYAYYYTRLKRNGSDDDAEFEILLSTIITLLLNVNTLLIILLKLFDFNFVEKRYMIVTGIIVFLISMFFYKRMDTSKKEAIRNRIPRYKWYVYQGYSALSLFLFLFVIYLVSPNT